ncbi:CHASE3 domain-containing protein [Sphingomonas sabuli]|uniref:histidine kinase n=1 Tax=Sphingomonas sabuli TaxID=2764186 RepID=A0A7G9L2B7_9SPHN|nr:sensor histidine kinase [Sphingomonas sabuli]QNM82766.1 CHASE3 domain-containing protein [Sphingomonas sabuli]
MKLQSTPDPAGPVADDRREGSGRRTVGLLLAVGAVMLVIAVVFAALTLQSITDDTDAVEHTLEVQASINRLSALNERIETGRRGFLIQPDPAFSATVQRAATGFDTEATRLRGLISDNPAQLRRLEAILRLRAEREALINAMFADPRQATLDVTTADFNAERGVIIVRTVRRIATEMVDAETHLLSQRNRNQLDSLVQLYTVSGIALALLVAVLLAAVLLVLRFNRDLTRAQARLRVANEGLEEAVERRTAELIRANQEIQRFAYIVSHDLRSPLVNVLGFTSELDQSRKDIRAFLEKLFADRPELRDETVWRAADEDLPEALDFIRKSTEKMDRLINSILELSRQGRRQLTPERLDMDALADGVVASLHQRAEDAGATVAVESLPPLESDRIAIEQILSNLVENALKYLQPGRPGEVTVRGRRHGRMVDIDVVDNGRGVAPADQERIFELFRRAGTQDQPGEGIGLANVRALAYRLGGTITMQSEVGEGSTFTLSLPDKFISRETVA